MPQDISNFLSGALLSDLLNFLVYAAIVVLFLVCLAKCIAPVMRNRRLLARAVRALKKGESAKRAWLEQTFLGKGALLSHWSEYLKHLMFADGEFHNPSAVEDYINEDTVIYGPGRATLSDAMPGLMVTLGFLGTLMGITQGLEGFDLTDTESVMSAIRRLVPGMQYAFTTSIVGVIASISLTLLVRIVNGSALRVLNGFYAALGTHAGIQSVDPLTQIAIYQQEQTALIQVVAEHLTGQMVGQMGSVIEKSVATLKRSIDDFVSFTTRDQMRGVDMLVQRFMQSMNESLGSQFQSLRAALESTNTNQAQLQHALQEIVDSLSGMSKELLLAQQVSSGLVSKFDQYMDKVGGSYQMVDEGFERIAANVEHLQIIARQQNGYLQSVGKLQGEIERAMTGFQTSADAFMKTFDENMHRSKSALESAADALTKSGDVLSDSHKKLVTGINKDVDRTYNAFFENTNRAVEQLGWMLEDVRTSIAKLPDLLDGTAALYAGQADKLTGALQRAQSALDDAVDRLGR